MRARFIFAGGLACGLWLAAQSDAPRQVELLARIRQHMKSRLEQVPNYTCLETVERFEQASSTAKSKRVDTIRIEVAQVNGNELFAMPGKKFEAAHPSVYVKNGFTANGMFAMHSRALFLENSARFTYAGEEEIEGRKLVRYDYQVARAASGFRISTGGRMAAVAYHGSFWSDPQTLDAYHFRLVAEDIPAELGVADAGMDIDYQSLRIGGAEALLPKRADLSSTEASGKKMRNITTFSNCKHYGSESVITFGK
jgi:hypothetical protein